MAWARKVLQVIFLCGVAGAEAPTTRNDLTFVAKFPDGSTVELLAISRHDTPRAWWRPDGQVIGGASFQGLRGEPTGFTGDAKHIRYDMMLQIHPANRAVWSMFFRASPSVESKWMWDMKEPSSRLMMFLPSDSASTNIEMAMATGRWTMVAQTDSPAAGSQDNAATTRGEQPAIRFLPATDSPDGVRMEIQKLVNSPLFSGDNEGGVVGYTSRGEVKAYTIASGPDPQNAKYARTTFIIPKTTLGDLAAVEYRHRPWQWMEFRNVSLIAGHRTPVEIGTNKKKR